MPNHCETDFSLYGRRDQVQAVLDAHFTADGTLDCDKVTPYPKQYKQMDLLAEEWETTQKANGGQVDWLSRPTDGFNAGGYQWCVSNWGTKWGTYDGTGIIMVEHENDMVEAHVSFTSAWSPPCPVMNTLAALYPHITFRAESFESGMGYKLVQEWKEGVQVKEKKTKYRGNRGG